MSSGIALLYCRSCVRAAEALDGHERDEAGDDRQRRDEDLRVGADQRRAARRRHVLRRQRALDLREVRRPVAERQDEAEAEHDAEPVGVDRVGDVADPEALPGVEAALLQGRRLDLVLQAAPAAHVVERDERQREQARDDDEELQDLVVDRRGQAAERDVDEHDRGGDDDRDRERPAEHQVDDQREREQVDAGDQHGRHGERRGVQRVGRVVEAQAQVVRDAADLGPVVEGHHHDAQEDHRGDRADPVEVHGRDAVLGTVGGHAEDLERAEVGGDEGQAGDPGGQRPAGQEEVEVRLDRQTRDGADPEHHDEVDAEDRVVERAGVEAQRARGKHGHGRLLPGRRSPNARGGQSAIGVGHGRRTATAGNNGRHERSPPAPGRPRRQGGDPRRRARAHVRGSGGRGGGRRGDGRGRGARGGVRRAAPGDVRRGGRGARGGRPVHAGQPEGGRARARAHPVRQRARDRPDGRRGRAARAVLRYPTRASTSTRTRAPARRTPRPGTSTPRRRP